jgi:hypothetical protein
MQSGWFGARETQMGRYDGDPASARDVKPLSISLRHGETGLEPGHHDFHDSAQARSAAAAVDQVLIVASEARIAAARGSNAP